MAYRWRSRRVEITVALKHPGGESHGPGSRVGVTRASALRVYLAITVLAGAALVAHGVLQLRVDLLLAFSVLLIGSLLTSTMKVALPLAQGGSTLSLSYIFNFIALLELGPAAAVPVVAATAWSQCTVRSHRPNPFHQTLFSMAALSLTAFAAGWAYQLAIGWTSGSQVGAAVVAATVYFFLNTGLVAGAVALSTGGRMRGVWSRDFLWSSPTYYIGALIAVLALAAVREGGAAWAVALAIPAYLSYRSYKAYSERIASEQQRVREVSEQQIDVIEALTTAIEAKDGSSAEALELLQTYAEGLAQAVGLDEDEVRAVRTAALLHDVGNLAVPEHILSKPGRLTPEEYERVKLHARVGADILKSVRFTRPVSPMILAHHERWDGRGYPLGLKGASIPIGARIVAVVDCFAAVLSARPYRPACTHAEAIAAVRESAGSALDPQLVDTFVRALPSLELKLQAARRRGRSGGTTGAVPQDRALEDIAVAHREGQVVHELAQALNATLNVADVAALLSSRLVSLVPFESSAAWVREDATGLYTCRHAGGPLGDALAGITAASLSELEAIVLSRAIGRAGVGVPAECVILAPLESAGDGIGALACVRAGGAAYTAEHRRVVASIAGQAAPVVANAVRYEQAREQSLTDLLTGLLNRRGLDRHLAHQLSRAEREGTSLTVLLFDMDSFKGINDAFGHDAGDRALQAVGQYLNAGLRDYDACARYGGDEFVVAAVNCSAAQGERRMRDLQAGLARLAFEPQPGSPAALSVSVGAATFPDDGVTPEALLAMADSRMYQDKSSRAGSAA